jgi:hypothetical protein
MDTPAFEPLGSCFISRPTTRFVAAIALLLGLAVLAASVAPPAIARARERQVRPRGKNRVAPLSS